ncbi:MAG: TAXI family TRAP transporter solute-binding subunit [Candidatus Freyarchaeota archaeon]
MKKQSVLRVFLILSLASFTFMLACRALAAEKTWPPKKKIMLRMATASTGGSWYPFGGAVCSIITKYVPNVEASAHPSAASMESIRLLMEGDTDLAMLIPSLLYAANHAIGPFEGKKPTDFRILFDSWPIDRMVVVRADSDIHKIADLRGKRVSVCAAGSGNEKEAKKILAMYGITYDDIKVYFMTSTEAATALKDGVIDAAMEGLGTPAPAYVNLCTQVRCRLIPMEEEMIQKFLEQNPSYQRHVIPANSYPGVDYDVPTVARGGPTVCRATMNEELVYHIVKAVAEHLDEVRRCHAMAKNMSLETMVGCRAAPFHPGAERYYKEVGVLK